MPSDSTGSTELTAEELDSNERYLEAVVARVRTVRGDIEDYEMGLTLSHEHLICDSSMWLKAPPNDELGQQLASREPTLETLWWHRQFPNSNRSVLALDDEQLAIDELNEFAKLGGGALVELTCTMGRDLAALSRISQATGVHVIAATGHYIAASHDATVATATIEELADAMAAEIIEGDLNGIRCGVIGELGLSWPVHPDEIKVLRAAAVAHSRTGAAISIHTAAHAVEEDSALVAADVLESAGADLARVVMGHMDTSLHRPDYHRATLARGCMIQYDLFGHEFFESENGFQSFGDTETVRAVTSLIRDGWRSRILLSHDTCYKIQLQKYGGYGYGHLLRNIVPRLKLCGVPEEVSHAILQDNPKHLFTIGDGI
jgi:phosphotriesterase-related protein